MEGGIGPRVKHWSFACFSENKTKFNGGTMAYPIFGSEKCPDAGRKHFQGFISFKNRKRLSNCKKVVPSAHFERVHGSVQENVDYCKNNNHFNVFSISLVFTEKCNPFIESTLLAEKGEFASLKEIYPEMYFRYKRTDHINLIFVV